MAKTKLHELNSLGQSVWLDYIQRSLIESGKLEDYVIKGLSGVTSNPTIFDQAISSGSEYDDEIQSLAVQNEAVQEIYEAIAVRDIQLASQVLRPVYDDTDGLDGYVSLEVNPHLAHDTQGTIAEVRRLWQRVDRPNVMIKVPATAEGLPAIQTLTADGCNINVTLMFSLEQYDLVAEAFITGLEQYAEDGGDPSQIASVASFFVSRIDSKIDQILDIFDDSQIVELKGKTGLAYAKLAYQRYKGKFSGRRWERLAAKGARVQRVLYGSTSTKNPDYPDTLYVDNLIGQDTINTLPPSTLEAFLDHGSAAPTLESDLEQARKQLDHLAELEIDLEKAAMELLTEGVKKFADSYDALIGSITEKKAELLTA
jgi:transaldolase